MASRRHVAGGEGIRLLVVALFLAAVAATTVFAAVEARAILPAGRLTPAEWLMVTGYPVLVLWVAWNFWISVVGYASLARPGDPSARPAGTRPIGSRLAVVMPIYNEDADRVFAGLRAIWRSLDREPRLRGFHLFVLSDTRDPDVAVLEELRWLEMRNDFAAGDRIFYRRRRHNDGRKAGNIRDFCERWGGAYDYMLVLDADSLMDGAAVLRLADRMEADPRLGLVQTWPRPILGQTLFGRVQQFAASVYGRAIAEGLAVLMGPDATYWGHNALIRVKAFAGCCGLPTLPGRAPLGGEVLSHDFVEAAMLTAGGWRVEIDSARDGSYEEAPPSLLSHAKRDRRWCQGNLQHLRIVTAGGLRPASRANFAMGIMAYLSSPLWCGFLIVGFLALLLAPPGLESVHPYAGVPLRIVQPEHAWILVVLPLAMLFLPKLAGLLAACLRRPMRRGHGGIARLLAGSVVETVFTTLIAPVVMLLHTRFVLEILAGRSSGWNPQARAGDGESLAVVARAHRGHTVAGLAAAGALGWLSLEALAWASPIVAGLVLSIPLSWLSGRTGLGRRMRHAGLLGIPEERAEPGVVAPLARACDPGAGPDGVLLPDRLLRDPRLIAEWIAASAAATDACTDPRTIETLHVAAWAGSGRSGPGREPTSIAGLAS